MKKIILTSFLILASFISKSQLCVNLHGQVFDYFSGCSIQGAEIEIENADGFNLETTNRKGRYHVELESNEIYSIKVGKEGMVYKTLIIDTRNTECSDTLAYDMDLRISLFEESEELEMDLFNMPIAIAAYDSYIHNMSWYNDYTNGYTDMVRDLMKEYEKLNGGSYK